MRRLLLISALVVALAFLLVGTAAADNGPHTGLYTTTTDACAGCHRAHRGKAEYLLKETTQLALCFSCHGSAATGADTNVEDGVYLERASGGAYGDVGEGLRGGGFVNALMDPDMDQTTASASVTSKHSVEETGTIWGNEDFGTGPGKTGVTLRCGSCHNPHGFADQDIYRVLRPIPEDSDATSEVVVPDEEPKKYNVEYWSGDPAILVGYRDPMADEWMFSDRDQRFAEWCAQCHWRYLANDFSGTGDPIFNYRHATHVQISPANANILVCQTCHVAHGTSATMAAYSGSVEWPDDTPGGGAVDSRLLHVNNRGVCIQCHEAPGEDRGCLSCHGP
ncbi:MAG: cytochrome c3 family protein [Anaerolineae bacterium]